MSWSRLLQTDWRNFSDQMYYNHPRDFSLSAWWGTSEESSWNPSNINEHLIGPRLHNWGLLLKPLEHQRTPNWAHIVPRGVSLSGSQLKSFQSGLIIHFPKISHSIFLKISCIFYVHFWYDLFKTKHVCQLLRTAWHQFEWTITVKTIDCQLRYYTETFSVHASKARHWSLWPVLSHKSCIFNCSERPSNWPPSKNK